MKIAVDFDGTVCLHEYPDIGEEVPFAIYWLKRFQDAGAKLILFTMRSDSDKAGPVLTQAVQWLESRGINLYGINTDPDQKSWTASPKAYANKYIDDAAAGCPLRQSAKVGGRSFVDWAIVGPMVMEEIERKKV